MAGTAFLKGVRFIVDDKGARTGVVIDLKDNAELWEDIYDRAVARRRAREPRVTLQAVKARLRKRGMLTLGFKAIRKGGLGWGAGR